MLYTFSHLPPELKLHILQFLPTFDLQQCRTTCRVLNRLVSDNETRLANDIQSREAWRLQNFLSYFFNNLSSVSFVEALNRWVIHRGIHADGTSHNFAMRIFAETWYKANEPNRPQRSDQEPTPQEVVAIRQTVRKLADAADVLVKVHVRFHEPNYENIHDWESGLFAGLEPAPKPYFELAGFVNEMRKVAEELRLNDAELRSMFGELKYTPSGRLKGKVHPYLDAAQAVRPRNLITRLLLGSESSLEGFCNSREIHDILGAPVLPSNAVFAYYVQDEWARSAVYRALTQGSDALKALERAVVMEQLFIY